METNVVKIKLWDIDVGYLFWDEKTGYKDKLYQGLPPMIADSLPDKWGNSLFRAWLRDNNISIKKPTP